MSVFVANAWGSLLTGLAVCVLVLGLWLLQSSIDGVGLISFLVRWVHIIGAMIWVGMIWFVNFVQIAAMQSVDDQGRATLVRHVVPRVAKAIRLGSHLTISSGIILLATTGYALDRWVFKTVVYVPPAKLALMTAGILGAIAMWMIVQFVISPSVAILLGEKPATDEVKAEARARIRTFARINLILATPVTFVMVAAGHLY